MATAVAVVWGIAYCKAYRKTATQLAFLSLARRWAEMGVPAEEAGAWASKGFLPGEAERHIAAGRTPQEASDWEAAWLEVDPSAEEPTGIFRDLPGRGPAW